MDVYWYYMRAMGAFAALGTCLLNLAAEVSAVLSTHLGIGV